MDKEIWRPVKGYEGRYEVSSFGRIRSLNYNGTGRCEIIKQCDSHNGYLLVCLYDCGVRKSFRVNRIVAEAFIPNPLNLPQVNHKDEDKTNNNIDNLEWCDAKYNTNYGTGHDRASEKQKNDGRKSKHVLQYSMCGDFIFEWPSTMEINRKLGFDRGYISNCCLGKYSSAYGFVWKYRDVV